MVRIHAAFITVICVMLACFLCMPGSLRAQEGADSGTDSSGMKSTFSCVLSPVFSASSVTVLAFLGIVFSFLANAIHLFLYVNPGAWRSCVRNDFDNVFLICSARLPVGQSLLSSFQDLFFLFLITRKAPAAHADSRLAAAIATQRPRF